MVYVVPPSLRMFVNDCISEEDHSEFMRKIGKYYLDKLIEIYKRIDTKYLEKNNLNANYFNDFTTRQEASILSSIKYILDQVT